MFKINRLIIRMAVVAHFRFSKSNGTAVFPRLRGLGAEQGTAWLPKNDWFAFV